MTEWLVLYRFQNGVLHAAILKASTVNEACERFQGSLATVTVVNDVTFFDTADLLSIEPEEFIA